MLDAKRASRRTTGTWTGRHAGCARRAWPSQAKRADREASEGAVAVGPSDGVGAIVELRSETDFVAKSAGFVALVNELADLVAAKGEDAVDERQDELDSMKATS